MSLFTAQQLENAWQALPAALRDTPFQQARRRGLSLKLESLQPTGSYKIRAAYSKLRECRADSPGVALSSSGNFAGAFTWAAAQFKIPAHLVVTSSVEQRKMSLAQEYPCQVHLCGDSYESRFEKLSELSELGLEVIDHRTDRAVFLGHSTIGWECLSQLERFRRILIPVSTGGLALGVAAALRLGGFEGEIIGVQAAGNPTLYESWQRGTPVKRAGIDTLCDALTATSIPQETFQLLREHLDEVLLVAEESVMKAVGFLALEEGVVAEPGAAVGIAALLENQRPWEESLCLISGRNVDEPVLVRCLKSWSNRIDAS